MFLDLNKITQLVIEPSSYCNLHCPQCPRFGEKGFLDKHLNQGHLDFSRLADNLNLNFLPNLDYVKLEGDYGDPAMNPDLLNIIDFFKHCNQVDLVTNGSIRSPKWFEKLATRKNVEVTFSIDGFEDTNHIYRINADWNKIMNNAKSFISAGGKPIWKMIVFKHNQHQVEQVRKFSQDLGFAKFETIFSDRDFFHNIWPVYIDGEYQYDLEIADNLQLNTKAHVLANNVEKFTSPKCKWIEKGKLYINYLGCLLPCCMTAGTTWKDTIAERLFRKIIGSTNDINLYQNSIDKIAQSDFYKFALEDSFASIKTCHNLCIKHCS